jgi:hypothetical protein
MDVLSRPRIESVIISVENGPARQGDVLGLLGDEIDVGPANRCENPVMRVDPGPERGDLDSAPIPFPRPLCPEPFAHWHEDGAGRNRPPHLGPEVAERGSALEQRSVLRAGQQHPHTREIVMLPAFGCAPAVVDVARKVRVDP